MSCKRINAILCVMVMTITIFLLSIVIHPTVVDATDATSDSNSQIPEGFDQTVSEFAEGIGLGWNLGSSLEAVYWNMATENPGGIIVQPVLEQYWYNPITTKAMIAEVKEAGFNAIRIPVSWRHFIGDAPDYTIRADLMSRVTQVVDYAIELDMYVMINIHHDGAYNGWLRATDQYRDSALEILDKVWTQIAINFIDYNEKLMFEGMNEVLTANNAWSDITPESLAIINEYNQCFVDAVRETGGNNTYRFLVCKTQGAMIDAGPVNGLVMPDDDRLILSVHSYETNQYRIERSFIRLKQKFIDEGIPVFIGEWGPGVEPSNVNRVQHADRFISLATKYGVKPFYWDSGGKDWGNANELWGALFNRRTLEWQYPAIVYAIVQASEREYEDPLYYPYKWDKNHNANWSSTAIPTHYEDGAVNIKWPGIASNHTGYQNVYAERLVRPNAPSDEANATIDRINATLARAKKEGRTIEFTVKALAGKYGTQQIDVGSLQVYAVINNTQIVAEQWINIGQERKFVFDVSNFNFNFNNNSTIQIYVQNYNVSNLRDVEVWVSPLKLSPPI